MNDEEVLTNPGSGIDGRSVVFFQSVELADVSFLSGS